LRGALFGCLQASIDGLVLLAMDSDNWIRLAAASPRPCRAPLESLQRASLALSSRPETGNTVVPPPGNNTVTQTVYHAVPGYDDDVVRTTVPGDGAHEIKGIDGIAVGMSSALDDGGGTQAMPENDETGPKPDRSSRGHRREAGLIGEGGKDDHEGTPTRPSRPGGGRLFDGPRPSSRGDDDSGIEPSPVVAG